MADPLTYLPDADALILRSPHALLAFGGWVDAGSGGTGGVRHLIGNLSARKLLLRALELDPGLQEARVALAQLYQGQGRAAEAAALYNDAYERSGDLKVAEMLVKLDMAQGREAEARELCDRIDDEGGGPERRMLIGWLRLSSREPTAGTGNSARDSPRSRKSLSPARNKQDKQPCTSCADCSFRFR